MYNRVIKHTATTQKNDVVAFEEISHSSSMASQDEKDISIICFTGVHLRIRV